MAICYARIIKDKAIYYTIQDKEAFHVIDNPPYLDYQRTGQVFQKADIQVLSPVCPSKIICVGLNYRSHALELDMPLPSEPLLFLKPITALANPNDVIELPISSNQVDYEGELAVVIGRQCKQIKPDEVNDHIIGYTLANDVTARDLQRRDGQWTRAKGFDGFCPVGPSIVSGVEPDRLRFQSLLNNEIKQNGDIEDFIFNIPQIVSFVSEVMTLYPEDIILTGTPPGIGSVKSGDKVTIHNERIGSLSNTFK